MRFALLLSLALAFTAGCQDATDPATDAPDEEAELVDTGGDASAEVAGPTLSAHRSVGTCTHGASTSVDLGAPEELVSYTVEVQYESGIYEQMQPDLYLRPSPLTLDAAMEGEESPVYRDGATLSFTCGYRWEDGDGARIAGVERGVAIGYRVVWLTMT